MYVPLLVCTRHPHHQRVILLTLMFIHAVEDNGALYLRGYQLLAEAAQAFVGAAVLLNVGGLLLEVWRAGARYPIVWGGARY